MSFSIMGILTIAVIGFISSILSGMLGIGGAIIKYPMLLYIPALVGVASFSAYEVSGLIAVEVLFSSLVGVWAYRKDGFIHKRLLLYMGTAIIIGSLIGSFGSSYLQESTINLVYGILAVAAAILMFIPKKQVEQSTDSVPFNRPLASFLAAIVGISSGIVGAGGGFLLVPIMLTILRIPTRVTIATSLAITFVSAIGGSFGKLMTGQVDYRVAFILIVISLIATPLGVRLGKKMKTITLRRLLVLLISATAIKIWFDIFT